MKSIYKNRVFQHIVFWCFYIVIYTANYAMEGDYGKELLITTIYLPFHLLFTYTQLYYLIPVFLLKKRMLPYIILTLLLTKVLVNAHMITFMFVVHPIRFGVPLPALDWGTLLTIKLPQLKSVFAFFMICAVAVSIKLFKQWFYEHDRNAKIEREKLQMEIDMLKAQVHPHFLFNTLNNLYALSLEKSDKTPLVVTHLAELLRYMLYECSEKEVLLSKEIEALKKYVELEKLRYSDQVEISFSCSGNMDQLLIAPLLLLPFVENSFKHGVSRQTDQCWINIQVHVSGNELHFHLSNSLYDHQTATTAGGIGLQNIKKRLQLIYPGKYNLDIGEEAEMHVVKLQLQLSAYEIMEEKIYPVTVKLQPAPAI